MNELLFFDTETTGIPNWKEPSGGDSQPHIVQLAAIRVDPVTRETKQTLDVIVRPENWEISPETLEVHGITKEYAMDVGVAENLALEMFLAMHASCSKRIAYNTTFDNRIIRIATKRYTGKPVIDAWKAGDYECAMILSRKIIGGKNPKQEDAYKYFTGRELVGAHNALNDVNACKEIYFEAKKRGEN